MILIGPFEFIYQNQANSSKESLKKRIFCNEKMTIADSELVIITGPSGAGKSTLLKLLKGIIPEYSSGKFIGEIYYNNRSLSGENFQKNLKEILFLFQNPFSQLIYPDVAEEFFFSMENFKFSIEQMNQKKDELNKVFNLDLLWNKKTSELSNGECQRLVLASLLAIDPKVLLLDEPTAFLDPGSRADFYQWLKKVKGSRTIIIVDHHLKEIMPLADLVINVSAEGEISLTPEKSKEIVSTIVFEKRDYPQNLNVRMNLSHINFNYPDQKFLLKDVNLTLNSNEVIVLKGKNGFGKSTLFKIIAGIQKPKSGKIEIVKNNLVVSSKKQNNEIGFIFQNPESHFFYDTINEELKAVAHNSDFKILMGLFFKDIDLDRSPFLLSEGEKRRLSLLMIAFLDKSVLLYDEPTFGQDQQSIEIIVEMIKYFKKQGRIQLIISHDDHFIELIADKVYELVDGQLMRLK